MGRFKVGDKAGEVECDNGKREPCSVEGRQTGLLARIGEENGIGELTPRGEKDGANGL